MTVTAFDRTAMLERPGLHGDLREPRQRSFRRAAAGGSRRPQSAARHGPEPGWHRLVRSRGNLPRRRPAQRGRPGCRDSHVQDASRFRDPVQLDLPGRSTFRSPPTTRWDSSSRCLSRLRGRASRPSAGSSTACPTETSAPTSPSFCTTTPRTRPAASCRAGTSFRPYGVPLVYQQGTYGPDDGVNRWMGAVGMDGNGNIAVGTASRTRRRRTRASATPDAWRPTP